MQAGSLTHCSGNFCYLLASINIFFAALTIPENIVVLVSLKRLATRKTWKTPIVLMAALATTDLLSGCISQTLYGYFLLKQADMLAEEDIKGTDFWLLLILNYSSYTLCGASLLIVAIMSIDRLLAVARPIAYKANVFCTKARLALVFIAASCLFFPALRFASTETVPIFTYMISGVVALSLLSTISVYIAVICIFNKVTTRHDVTNSSIFKKATRASNRNSTISENNSSLKEKKLTKSFAVIAVTLISMYLPQLILKPLTLSESGGLQHIPVSLEDIANTLLYCNSFINPMIYALRHNGIRSEIKAMFCTRVRNEKQRSFYFKKKSSNLASSSSSTEPTVTECFTPLQDFDTLSVDKLE